MLFVSKDKEDVERLSEREREGNRTRKRETEK